VSAASCDALPGCAENDVIVGGRSAGAREVDEELDVGGGAIPEDVVPAWLAVWDEDDEAPDGACLAAQPDSSTKAATAKARDFGVVIGEPSPGPRA
jgi:hypothetical protein